MSYSMPARSFVSRHFGGPQKMAVFVVLELGRRDTVVCTEVAV